MRRRRPEPPLIGAERHFLSFALRAAGLSLESYRPAPLLRRLPACLRTLGADSPEEALHILQASPSRLGRVLDALLIGVTEPFRDPALFEALRQIAAPDLLRLPRLRVHSVACSDGAELYSVAMLLADLGGPSALARLDLLGTDCRPGALHQAAAGRFASLGGVPPRLAARYLVPDGKGWRLAPEIRARARFELADALRPAAAAPPVRHDLVLCRNLAIYLAPEVVPALWDGIFASLAPGGYLAVGKAERVRIPGLRQVAPWLYRREGDAR